MNTRSQGRTNGLRLSRLFLAAAIVALTAQLSSAQRGEPARPLVEGELLVKFRGGPKSAAAWTVRDKMRHAVKHDFEFIGWQHIQLPRGMSIEEGLKRYREMPDVLAAQPNRVIQQAIKLQPLVSAKTGGQFSSIPDDPMFAQQYALARIGATNAWAVTTGSSNVVVAVIDGGINYLHEDLAANMWRNPGEIPGNGIDDDGNGYVDDVFGTDPAGGDSDPMGADGFHGTSVASVIGAVGANRTGMTGLNWSTSLMAVRVFSDGSSNDALLLAGYQYVLLMKSRGINIRVANMSYGYGNETTEALNAAHAAMDSAGILQVNGAGNASQNIDVIPTYPANLNLPTIICVAGSDANDGLAGFSGYGRTNVDLAAPAVGILMASGPATNIYITDNGNSFSGPYVAGAAALLFSAYPSATALEVKAALLASVDVLPAFTNKMVSNGRLNVGRAVQLLGERLTNAPPNITFQPQGQTVFINNSFVFSATATGAQPLNYQWRFQGADLAHATNATLTLNQVAMTDAGDYTVVVSNPVGMVTSVVARLVVISSPVILAEPLSRTVLENTTTNFTVSAMGAVPLAYQWRFNGNNLTGATGTNLALTNIQTSQAGEYTVVVANSYGATTSAVAVLTVLVRPSIIQQPQSQTVLQGGTAYFSVLATGTPPLYYRWLRNGLLWASNRFPDLVITNCQSNGLYRVIVGNLAGTTNSLPVGGTTLTVLRDFDRDGMADVWEVQYGFNTNNVDDALLDFDGDGMSNRDEYLAGTNPTNVLSYLRIDQSKAPDSNTLSFVAVSNRTYAVEFTEALGGGQWSKLADVIARATNRTERVIDPTPGDRRYYRVVIPRP